MLSDARTAGRTIGFVPTMGALHDGHLSLVRRARAECDVVVLSIFVNPLQFDLKDDLERYPRPFDADTELAAGAGVDVMFAPSSDEMFPENELLTTVRVAGLADVLEGASRPGHFDGVCTVVTKLFSVVGECRAYFGEKDWQQLTIVKQMTADLSLPAQVIACPIVRDADGLALSSRNVQLTAVDRAAALSLNRALHEGVEAIAQGCRDVDEIRRAMTRELTAEPLIQLDYADVVDDQLRVAERIEGDLRLLVAARVGTPRLIDNMGVTV